MSPLLICAVCKTPLSTMREALTHCPTAYPEERWHPSHEEAAAKGGYCSAMHIDDWAASGRARPRP